ncbi:RHS repeat-associated core domain-containing protein [Pseudoalteromonas sp. R3]|uniref:RHS repeat-associated core domain-containing protein n=1 Tax=Pseudoalteromonas sp. R3 TaxID=1709477 RepID=UPI0006B3FB23|nr:RHS repeat-associated core domain-containing protein [Pseudoalteromonas sp. R3]AZZ97488.1 RHS repeat-associated core domain-containing protein [Pseudoalteromonas sp. R3]
MKKTFNKHCSSLLLSVSLSITSVYADEYILEQDTKSRALSVNAASSEGDAYDPISGTISFAVTDISIPGNSSLPVELKRVHSPFSFMNALGDVRNTGMGTWLLDVPYIRATYVDSSDLTHSFRIQGNGRGWENGYECSDSSRWYTYAYASASHQELGGYWSGVKLHIPGQVTEDIREGSGDFSGMKITKSLYKVTDCYQREDGQGQGFEVTAPDGTKYYFDHKVVRPNGLPFPIGNMGRRAMMMATKVVDKFGNSVSYRYNGNKLVNIKGSDGRRIDLIYSKNMLTSAKANLEYWNYIYSDDNKLEKVVLPNKTEWKYPAEFYDAQYRATTKFKSRIGESPGKCEISDLDDRRAKYFTVTTPSGLNIKYGIKTIYHGREDVRVFIEQKYSAGRLETYFNPANCSARRNLVYKQISGDKINAMTWRYSYSENAGLYHDDGRNVIKEVNRRITRPLEVAFPYGIPSSVTKSRDVKTTTISGQNEKVIYYIDRNSNSYSENKIKAIYSIDESSSKLKKKELSYFAKGRKILNTCDRMSGFRDGDSIRCSLANNLNVEDFRVNLSKVVEVLSSDDSQQNTEYTTEYKGYDKYGHFTKKVESNSFSGKKEYREYSYQHDLDLWELGKFRTEKVSNSDYGYKTVREIKYHGSGTKQPYEELAYGRWTKRYSQYHDDGNIKRIEYNSNGTGPQFVEFSSYFRGVPRVVTKPNRYGTGTVSRKQYSNSSGKIYWEKDFNGVETYYAYDPIGRITAIYLYNDSVLGSWYGYQISWDDNENKRTVTRCELEPGRKIWCDGPAKSREVHYFDALNRLKQVTFTDLSEHAVSGHSVVHQKFNYNHRNQIVFRSYKSASSTETKGVRYKYDTLGRLKSVSKSNLGTTKFSYLANSKVKKADAEGNVTVISYDAKGTPKQDKPTEIDSPEGVITEFTYNIFDKLTHITQKGAGKSLTETRLYDAYQGLCLIKRTDVGNTLVSTDAQGALNWHLQGASNTSCVSSRPGNATIFTYDNLGDLHKVNYPEGTPDLEITRDKLGNVLTQTAGNVEHRYSYNSRGLLEDEQLYIEDHAPLMLDYGYDKFGHISRVVYPDGTNVSYKPNAFGQPTQVRSYNQDGSLEQTFARLVKYHPNGILSSFYYGNGVKHDTILDADSLLPHWVRDEGNMGKVVLLQYGFDNNENVTSIRNLTSSSYSLNDLVYDGLNRLIEVSGGASIGSSTMRYDALGNIRYYKNRKRTLNYTYNDTTNRLTSVSGYSGKYGAFQYDSRGNITHNGQFSLTYNRANQMTSANGNHFVYDGHNRRVKQVEQKGTSYSMYSQAGQLMYRENHHVSGEGVNYIYLGKKLIAKYGSVTPKGVLADEQNYLPYGETLESNNDDVGYTGHKFDKELGLSYMQARYYDPAIGRFYSNDPVDVMGHIGRGNPVHGFNRYTYANNNPYKYVDPDGEFATLPLAVFGGIVGAIGGAVQSALSSPGDFNAMAKSAAIGGGIGFLGGLTAGTSLAGASSAAVMRITVHMSAKESIKTMAQSGVTTGIASGGGNLGAQLASNGGDLSKVDVPQVVTSTAVGALVGTAGGGVVAAGGETVAVQATAMIATEALNAPIQAAISKSSSVCTDGKDKC